MDIRLYESDKNNLSTELVHVEGSTGQIIDCEII